MRIPKVTTTRMAIFFTTALIICGLWITSDVKAQQQQTQGRVHEKSLSVASIGSGWPGGSFGSRSEAMTLIQYKGKYIVLDSGYGSVLNLAKFNYPVKNIDILMYTHLHADHSMDFMSLMLTRWASGGRELELIGPPRIGDFYNFFKSFYRDDMIYRAIVFPHHTLNGALTGVNVREIKGSNKFSVGDISIESTEMVHTMYDLAYKFVIDGTTIVVSGDTSYNETLLGFAKNADMLVLDGSWILNALKPPAKDDAFDLSNFLKVKVDGEIFQPGPNAGNFGVESHLNYADIIKISAQIAPKKLLLTHLLGALPGKFDPHTDALKYKVVSDLKKSRFRG